MIDPGATAPQITSCRLCDATKSYASATYVTRGLVEANASIHE